MKKITLVLSVLILIISSCSSDDNGSNSSNGSSFVSKILVDSKSFTPLENTDDDNNIVTSYDAGINNGEANSRTFHLFKLTSNLATSESIQISVIYPVSQTNINGTYSLKISDIDVNRMIQGSYTLGFNSYLFDDGSLTVVDLGNNKFKLTFNNVSAIDRFDMITQKTITGYCEGEFIDEE